MAGKCSQCCTCASCTLPEHPWIINCCFVEFHPENKVNHVFNCILVSWFVVWHMFLLQNFLEVFSTTPEKICAIITEYIIPMSCKKLTKLCQKLNHQLSTSAKEEKLSRRPYVAISPHILHRRLALHQTSSKGHIVQDVGWFPPTYWSCFQIGRWRILLPVCI